jgi:hypothetical protein
MSFSLRNKAEMGVHGKLLPLTPINSPIHLVLTNVPALPPVVITRDLACPIPASPQVI